MHSYNFETPTRQSAKGIIIIFGAQLFKFFKAFIPILIGLIVSFQKKGSIFGLSSFSLFLLVLAILIILIVIAILRYLNFRFYISNEGFHLTKGIINKESLIISKSKIQNIYIKQNVLQQLINVVSLNIETAGDTKAEVEISALPKEIALKLKKELFANTEDVQLNENKTSVFFKASPQKLFLEGVSQNHLKSLIIILAFFVGLYYEFKDFFENSGIEERLDHWFKISTETFIFAIIFNLLIILGLILSAFLFSLVKTFLINYNLQVVENNKTIEISKGLLNKVSLSLTPSRIQNIIVTNNRLKRFLGLNTLSVKQTMINKKQQQNLSIVALSSEQVQYLINKIFQKYSEPIHKQKPDRYFLRIKTLQSLVPIVLLNSVAYSIGIPNFWIYNVLLFALAMAYTKISYKKSYYNSDELFLTVGSGFIETKTEILELHKIQSIELTQSIFQKRKKIASLHISTASSTVKIPFIKEERAKDLMDYLLYRVEFSPKNWM